MEFSLVMTTCGDRAAAETLAESIVAARLAACVQITEIASVYEWQGKISKDKEQLLLIKGRRDLFERLRDHILANHSYDVPEIIQLDIAAGSPGYLAWMAAAAP